tara:strand:- start:46 stop:465 length:420 start_codon:yes stop_codon:yes gene_type:complete
MIVKASSFMNEKNYVIIFLGTITIILSIFFQKINYLFISMLIYGIVLVLSGIYYKQSKFFFWTGIITMIPWIALIYFQFFRRLYAFIRFGGEQSNGMGSPLMFLMGWLRELPFLIIISIISYGIYKDLKYKRFQSLDNF